MLMSKDLIVRIAYNLVKINTQKAKNNKKDEMK
ncbi:MAG: hypothetical protein K0S93_2287 [Nitrososphaeraceae archaeon]|jgi:hypothetical protein|nr:hypothetical protein [Nitrososphaeraceae archaeon]